MLGFTFPYSLNCFTAKFGIFLAGSRDFSFFLFFVDNGLRFGIYLDINSGFFGPKEQQRQKPLVA